MDRLYATKEVVLCCGALDTPRVLMHSGIGPEDQLKQYGIPVVHANQHVGANLMDHHHVTPTFVRADDTTTRHHFFQSKELQAAARAQWDLDGTGTLSEMSTGLGIVWQKLDSVFESPEFQALPAETRTHLQQPTVPTFEWMLNACTPHYYMDPENSPAMTTIFFSAAI